MRLQLRSSLVKPAKKVIGKQRLTVLVNVSFPAPTILIGVMPRALPGRANVDSAGSACAGPAPGGVAEWSCSGLQSRVRRFDSDLRLHPPACLPALSPPGR